MKLKEFARIFGMTVDQLSEYTGYTRQAFHYGIRNTAKGREAIQRLHDLNARLRRLEKEEAERRYNVRAYALRELEQQIVNGGEHNA